MQFHLAHTSTDVLSPDQLPADLEWVPALVPGGVHESLVAAGVIPHPFADQNEQAVMWVEDEVWWYRGRLDAPAGRQVLELPSVDTVAEIWLDGVHLGSHANAFRPFRAEVDLVEGSELVVRIQPPMHDLEPSAVGLKMRERIRSTMGATPAAAEARNATFNGLWNGDPALTLRRKPGFSWGWDFVPRVASIGLLEEPRLLPLVEHAITGQHLRTARIDHEHSTADVLIDVEVTSGTAVDLVLVSPSGRTTQATLPVAPGTQRAAGVVKVADAELWWTHDLGGQALYDVRTTLRDGDAVLAETTIRMGLRTIELDQSVDPDQPGRLFRLVLNGTPIFARGANWTPPSMLRGSVAADHVRGLVELSARGGMNMIRIWGGGAYEQDAFYETCDELGVLVWHDFMFVCFDYPSRDAGLQAEVVAEAEHQVRRLRNHPSIALWAGSNEVEAVHAGIHGTLDPNDEWGWEICHVLLPAVVQRCSPGTIYRAASPWADDWASLNGVVEGDRHAWEVWHGINGGTNGRTDFDDPVEAAHFLRFREDEGRFISEFGISSAPQLETMQRWSAEALEIDTDALAHRIQHTPKDKILPLLAYETGEPRDVHEYVDYSMVLQAEGLKYGIEHYRRRQPHCSGTLVWQLNDPWPGMSWSLIDFEAVPKAAYWYLQRTFAPVLASFEVHDDGRVDLWVTNSGRTDVDLDLLVELEGFDGKTVESHDVQHRSGAGSSVVVWSASDVGAADRLLRVSEASAQLPANRSFFGRIKDLPLGGGELESVVRVLGDGVVEVDLTARGYCYFTRVTSTEPGPRFSTNYLDLRDGETVTIRVERLRDVADLRVATWGSRLRAL